MMNIDRGFDFTRKSCSMLLQFFPHKLGRNALVLATLFVVGCGDPNASPEPIQCSPDELLQNDGTCFQVGLPIDMPCPPGELVLAGGGCQAAGIPVNACGKGFEHDGNGGCRAILPAESCPPGQMAVPGETMCHEVSSCGDGTWGDIPIEADAHFVDQAYSGNDSDGSQMRPWKTIQEAINNVKPGGMVAVAAGIYVENVRIDYKRIRLWGRCPSLVEISGASANPASLTVYAAKSGESEVRGLSLTKGGLLVSSAKNVVLEDLWIHDTLDRGISIADDGGLTSVTVKNALIENTAKAGVYIFGAETTWEGVVIRDNESSCGFGVGENQPNPTGARATMRGCLLERNADWGVLVADAEMTIEDTLVRDTLPGLYDAAGIAAYSRDFGERSNLTVRGCVLERNYGVGLSVIGSTALIENTTVRDTQVDTMGREGRGMSFVDDLDTKDRANVTVRASLLDSNHEIALAIFGSDTTIEGVLIRNTLPNGMGESAGGMYVADHALIAERPKITVRGSVVEGSHHAGISLQGCDGTIETSVVRGTLTSDQGLIGRGISIENSYKDHTPSDVTIRSCLVEKSHEIGIVVTASRAVIESSTIRESEPNDLGGFGRGIGIQGYPEFDLRSEAIVRACLIDRNYETGMYIAQSEVTVEDTIVRDTKALANSLFGDGISARDDSNVNFARLVVERNARAGIANFGSRAKVLSSTITCNAFDIEGETSDGMPFSYDGSTGWQCSQIGAADCTTLGECNVRSAGLAPPPALGSAEP